MPTPSPAELQRLRAEKRAAALLWSKQNAINLGHWTIQPAIGSTGGAANVGWEMHRKGHPSLYYASKEQCEKRAAMDGEDPVGL